MREQLGNAGLASRDGPPSAQSRSLANQTQAAKETLGRRVAPMHRALKPRLNAPGATGKQPSQGTKNTPTQDHPDKAQCANAANSDGAPIAHAACAAVRRRDLRFP